MNIVLSLIAAATVLFSAVALALPCVDADLLVKEAHIISMDDARHVFTSMAVRNGKILAVSQDGQLTPCAGISTKTVDLRGQTVLPGLIDIHTHAIEWTKTIVLGMLDAGYPTVKSISEVVAAVKKRASTAKPGEMILGVNWDDAKLAERRYINRRDLDPVSPDNPVVLMHESGHLLTANSAALKLAGVSKDTKPPQGGVIEHDGSGELTGVIKDSAMVLFDQFSPTASQDAYERAAKLVSQKAAEVGLTTIHDINPPAEAMRGYQDALAKGDLQIRVQLAPLVASIPDAERVSAMGAHTGFGNEYLKYGAVKMYAD